MYNVCYQIRVTVLGIAEIKIGTKFLKTQCFDSQLLNNIIK